MNRFWNFKRLTFEWHPFDSDFFSTSTSDPWWQNYLKKQLLEVMVADPLELTCSWWCLVLYRLKWLSRKSWLCFEEGMGNYRQVLPSTFPSTYSQRCTCRCFDHFHHRAHLRRWSKYQWFQNWARVAWNKSKNKIRVYYSQRSKILELISTFN